MMSIRRTDTTESDERTSSVGELPGSQLGLPTESSWREGSCPLPKNDQCDLANKASKWVANPAATFHVFPQVATSPDPLALGSPPNGRVDMRRNKTWSVVDCHDMRRSEAPVLSPEALAHLHKLHEAFLKYSSREVEWEDTSHDVLDSAWGDKGSWHVYAALPSGPEHALRCRRLSALPKACGEAEAWLRKHSAAAINSKGRKGPCDTKPGEDNFSFSMLENGWEVLCVMDGHGLEGEWPATRAVRTMPFFLQQQSCATMLQHGKAEAALQHAFAKVQADLITRARIEDVELQACGCTAVCCMWSRRLRRIWVASTGDSRACLIVPGKGVVAQTEDHKPTVPAEAERIERMGGEITRTEFEDGYVECRVNIAGQDFPGISMTRSLGDLSVKECGVIADPQVAEWSLSGRAAGALLLAATDGVWEFLETEQVAEIVLNALAKGRSYKEAIQEVLQAARKAWAFHEGAHCDDITISLVSLDGLQERSSQMVSQKVLAGSCAEGICKGGCSTM